MRIWYLSALTALLGVGCASGGDDAALTNTGQGGSSASGGQPQNGDLPSSLKFEPQDPLLARDQVTLKLQALPRRVYHVRFALPTTDGDPLDAVLDTDETDTNDRGVASVVLTAPSTNATFVVRANVDSVSATLPITVTDPGIATVQVQPRYPSALRDITTWIASAYPDKTCADVPGIPPEDGPLVAPPAAKAQAPVLSGVPAGKPLAITLRSGHFVGGCTSVAGLGSGPGQQVVQVSVLNRPIDLSTSTLSLALGLATPDTVWSALLISAGASVVAALDGNSADDVDALLDAMREASGDARQTFESTRKTENWDGLVRAKWGAPASNKLRDAVEGWLAAGRLRLGNSAHLIEGTLAPVAQADPLASARAELTLTAIAGLDPAQAGFVSPASVSWSASPDDNVIISTFLYFSPSQLAAGLGQAVALDKIPSAASAPGALSTLADCAGLSSALVAAGASPSLAYPGCDGSCMQSLCESAMGALWLRAAAATALSPTRLSVSATGKAYVGDAAAIAGMGGSWLGELKSPGGTSTTGGTLTALDASANK